MTRTATLIERKFNAARNAIEDLGDALECDHAGDCPFAGNHKGGLDWYDACDCGLTGPLTDMLDALDDVQTGLRK